MSTEVTHEAITTYLRLLGERGPYGAYFADDMTFTLVWAGQEVKGQEAVEQFIRYFHEQAFDAQPVVKSLVVAGERATAEFEFVGTHIGEFLGVAATGRQVNLPYAVVYDFAGDKITALRAYLPIDVLLQQLTASPADVPAAA